MNNEDFCSDFDSAFSTHKQTDFEEWFCDMAELVWGSDFEKIKPGGPQGDKKCDGRLISAETVFQCYAPESPSTFTTNAAAKVANSFPEVTQFWPNLKEWVFVHNNNGGIPPRLSDKLEALRSEYPHIKISEGSRNYLKNNLHDKLNGQQLIDLYPQSFAMKYRNVEMEHIRPLLRKLIDNVKTPIDPTFIGEIPDEKKLEFNQLSLPAKVEIKAAFTRVGIVDRYISSLNTPTGASQLQTKMKSKYEELKFIGYEPDEIIGKLLSWIGDDQSPIVRQAAYVVLAYYFDACDIFENAPISSS
ncbi:ABC-three component system protein [Hyphomonas sp. UBA3195]|uniref:ABC-three component system protein n=1 Tax=Hyphomonas sp. UBA3195 TaxID=1946622 RepID=UPI0025BD36C1|nr:ABC-three component system protein [Hyphomonas sp. UBA3195]|tara:strand:+ start:189 stop:1094 length:906 start_codon:yes stop_codon:yes gene_type:complete